MATAMGKNGSKSNVDRRKELERSARPRLEFHGGFYTGKARWTTWQTIQLFSPPFQEISLGDISAAQIIDSVNRKDAGGALIASAAGGLLLGPIGAAAGLLLGGNKQSVTFEMALKDGRLAIVSSTPEVFHKIRGGLISTQDDRSQLLSSFPADATATLTGKDNESTAGLTGED